MTRYSGKSSARVFHSRMLDAPKNNIALRGGGLVLSAFPNAATSLSKLAPVRGLRQTAPDAACDVLNANTSASAEAPDHLTTVSFIVARFRLLLLCVMRS